MATVRDDEFVEGVEESGRAGWRYPTCRVPHISILRCGHRAKRDRSPPWFPV